MKSLLKNNKGSISIIGVIITIIIVTVLSGYLGILNSSWVYNEVQSIMDLSATNTLQASLDTEALRREILGVNDGTSSNSSTSIGSQGQGASSVNQNKINSTLRAIYQNELNKNLGTNSIITGINLVSFDADLVYTSWGSTYNGSAKSRPQLRLDAVVQVKIKINKDFDGLSSYNLKMFNAKNGGDITISVAGVTGDGETILNVRTLSRILYK